MIIPQLFSRLNHHEPYVRRRVSELLCRVAKDSPHLIIFPTVVGSAQEKNMDLHISKIPDELDDAELISSKTTTLSFCFNSLLATLSTQSPETVNQVQLLVKELRRITLLWDELWLMSLAQVYAERAKRFIAFETEFKKLDKTSEKLNFATEKYRLLMRPLIFTVERLHEKTSKKPETINEKGFQDKFMELIENTLKDMKDPFNPAKPLDAWQKFKSLYGTMQARVQKRMSCSIRMSDISPVLVQMKNTMISMPGVEPTSSGAVYIK